MSEKGQGDSATPGTATDAGSGAAGGATTGAVPGGGGNQAEQTGPGNVEGPVDDATGTRSGWDDASARAALEDALGPENVLDSIDTSDLGKPEILDTSEESVDAEEPDLPGGGPTDTRTGWDYPPGQDGPRGEERPSRLRARKESTRRRTTPSGSRVEPNFRAQSIHPSPVELPSLSIGRTACRTRTSASGAKPTRRRWTRPTPKLTSPEGGGQHR